MTRYFLPVCFVLVLLFFTVATPTHAADTTFTVNHMVDLPDTNPGDGLCRTGKNTCTLRAAVQEANAFCGSDYCQETIVLPAGLFKLTRVGADNTALYGDLDITGPVAIRGAGMGLTIIDGNAGVVNDRIFHLIDTANLSLYVGLEDMTLTNSKNKRGGAIYNQGMSLHFTDSEIRSTTSTYWGGGAIYNDDGSLDITGSLFSQNIAQGTYGFGGVIFIEDADLAVSQTMFMNNSGTGIGAGSWSYGGAIYAVKSAVDVDQSTFFQNTTTNYGGAIYLSNGSLRVYKSYIQDNYAATAGGGIMVSGAATLKLELSSVTGNMADINVGDGGGGLYLNTDSAEITNSEISNNSATIGGGLFHAGYDLLITGSTISDNYALPDGGGIYHDFGTMTLIHSTLSGNNAWRGGGLYQQGYYGNTTTIFVNSTVSGNVANETGGGIYNDDGSVALYNATIAANQAAGNEGTPGTGGGIYNVTGGVRLQNTLLADNFHPDPIYGDVPDDCFGEVESSGYNLVESDHDCAILGDETGNVIGQDPELGPLQNNGGLTQTHAIPQTSKALDAANPNGCVDYQGSLLEKDQRGNQRPFDGDGNGTDVCDIGAFEYQ